jgi:type II pantothenate kinase
LIRREYHPLRRPETGGGASPVRPASRAPGRAIGVDVGATLAKLTSRADGAAPSFELVPAAELDRVAEAIARLRPTSIGLTGGGAAELSRLLSWDTARVNEFAAWGAGAAALLHGNGGAPAERYLLVSLGTGTSIMLVDGMAVTRVGGTALGGGTIMGLGARLAGEPRFEALCELAAGGSRGRVDLLVSDIYRAGEIPLAGDLTASSFGKLARRSADDPEPRREDLAQAVMGLVAENVALICSGLAAATQVRKIVFGGSTLRSNSALASILLEITRLLGREPLLMTDGEFAGSLGALLLAADR